MAKEIDSLESVIEKNLKGEDLQYLKRILYGKELRKLNLPQKAVDAASFKGIDLRGFGFDALAEDLRAPRFVRVGIVQNSIVEPTYIPVSMQREAIYDEFREIVDMAAQCGVNIICFQEFLAIPFAFCTRERHPWSEFAESAEDGPTTSFFSELAAKYDMCIIFPILERDETQGDTIWNTVVVISNSGNVLGKSRKNHIPQMNDFNESHYYMESELDHPVYQTKWGKIAINICYGRRHSQNWMTYGLNGAEIVFNPSPTIEELSEPMWEVEARCAAYANNYFTCAINRVGIQTFPREFTSGDGKPADKDVGHFYGASYIAGPDGSRTPGLSRLKDGFLIAEMDLNLCRQQKDMWSFRMTQRLSIYADLFHKASQPEFQPQVVCEHGKNDETKN